MPYTLDHFGKIACFDDSQAHVVKALLSDYLKLFSTNVLLEVETEALQMKLQDLQALVDASISHLDPDIRT